MTFIHNSVDAESTCIAIKLNPETYKVQVVDNGIGITKDLLRIIGTRYFTSKWNDDADSEEKTKYFGYRGECLASIKNSCSRLMIISRPSAEDVTYCKVFEGSKPPIVDETAHQRVAKGTTIIIDNFLGHAPVRQKRLVMSDEIQKVKRHVQALALMHPSVYFTMRDDSKGVEILRIERTRSTFKTFVSLFPNTVKNRSSMVRVTAEEEGVQMKAMICTESGRNNRRLQFVYVNKRYFVKSEIRKQFDQLLSNGNFFGGASNSITRGAFSRSALSKTRRNFVFILNIRCSSNEYDLTLQPDGRRVDFRNPTKIRVCLIKLVQQFLNQITITDRPTAMEAEANYLFKKTEEKQDVFVPKRIFEKLNYAHTVFGLPANRRPDGEIKSGSGATFQNNAVKLPRAESRGADRIEDVCFVADVCRKRINEIVQEDRNRSTSVDKEKSSNFTHGSLLLSCVSEKPTLGTKTVRRNPEKQRSVNSVNEVELRSSKSEFADSASTVSSIVRSRGRSSSAKCVKTNSSIRFYDLKKRYHLNRMNRFQLIKEKPAKMCWLHKRETTTKIYSKERGETKLLLTSKRRMMRYTMKISPENTMKAGYDPFLKKCLRKCALRKENVKKIEHNSNPQNLLKQEVLKKDNFKFSPKVITQFSNDDIRFPYCGNFFSKTNCVESMQESLTPFTGTCRRIWREKSILATFNSHQRYEEMPRISRPIFTSDDFIHVPRICQKRMQNCQELTRWNELEKTPKQVTTGSSHLQDFFEKQSVDSPKNFHKINEKMMKLRLNSPLKVQNSEIFDTNEQTSFYDRKMNHQNLEIRNKMSIASSSSNNYCADCCCRCHEREKETENVTEYVSNFSSAVNDLPATGADALPDANLKILWCENSLHSPVLSADDARSTSCKRAPYTTTSLAPFSFFDDVVSALSDSTKTEEKISLENNFSPIPPLANTDVLSAPVFQLETFPDPVRLTDKKLEVGSSRFTNSDNMESAINETLIEKMKFKMKSKFLMSFPVTEIPKGMMEVPMSKSDTISLSKDEKNDLRDLVKRCNLKNHITLDDSGNSCLRIFPYLKRDENELAEKKNDERALVEENCSLVFSKLDLKSIEFFVQIDRKFLLAFVTMNETGDRVLVAFDQHAVDERIRLERLFKDYVNENGVWKSVSINPPIFLNLSWSDIGAITDFEQAFKAKGLHFEFNRMNTESCKRFAICVVKVPTCLFNKASNENTTEALNSSLKELVESTIRELIDDFVPTRSLAQKTLPKTLQNAINFEACRGAVKFGDILSFEVCVALLKSLSHCDLPYQCAHGRPLLAPLVNFARLKHLEKQPPRSTFDNLRNWFQRPSSLR